MSEEERNKSFVFYESFQKTLDELPDDKALTFYRAICLYGLYGTVPDFTGLEKAVWVQIQYSLDVAKTRYNNCVENGKKGGRPKSKNQPAEAENIEENQEETKEKPKENQEITKEKPKENQEITKEKPKENQEITKEETKEKPKPNLNDNVNVNDNVNEDADANDNVSVRVQEVERWCSERNLLAASKDLRNITAALAIKGLPIEYLDYALDYVNKKSFKARDGTLCSFKDLPEANQRGMFITAVTTWQDMEQGYNAWHEEQEAKKAAKPPSRCPVCHKPVEQISYGALCRYCNGYVIRQDGKWILEPWTNEKLKIVLPGNKSG